MLGQPPLKKGYRGCMQVRVEGLQCCYCQVCGAGAEVPHYKIVAQQGGLPTAIAPRRPLAAVTEESFSLLAAHFKWPAMDAMSVIHLEFFLPPTCGPLFAVPYCCLAPPSHT